ncbi:MAG: hypothetical protein ABIO36_07475, partial [Pyrinomonadaceae bacterium]
MKLTLSTPILEFPRHEIANLSPAMSQKLAITVAGFANKTDPALATVADLLNYFPARYEDRSKFLSIDQLENEMEAAVEVYVKVSGGFRVG